MPGRADAPTDEVFGAFVIASRPWTMNEVFRILPPDISTGFPPLSLTYTGVEIDAFTSDISGVSLFAAAVDALPRRVHGGRGEPELALDLTDDWGGGGAGRVRHGARRGDGPDPGTPAADR